MVDLKTHNNHRSHIKTKNSKIIFLSGLSRGGTNIVWNILQSHPQVCSPILEVGHILDSDVFWWLPTRLTNRVLNSRRFIKSSPGRFINRWIPTKLTLRILSKPQIIKSPPGRFFYSILDTTLFNWKLRNFGHIDNGEKHEGIPYTQEEVQKAVLCPKSVDWDIYLTEYFAYFCEQSFFIGLIRNGYAWCYGWLRRGRTAAEAGRAYRHIGQLMIDYHQKNKHYKIVKFEDVLNDPFALANELFKFAELEPEYLDKLRLKSKNVLSGSGEHTAKFGKAGHKYWFDQTQIQEFLDPRVNEIQMKLLNEADRLAFEKQAKPILDYFNYT